MTLTYGMNIVKKRFANLLYPEANKKFIAYIHHHIITCASNVF